MKMTDQNMAPMTLSEQEHQRTLRQMEAGNKAQSTATPAPRELDMMHEQISHIRKMADQLDGLTCSIVDRLFPEPTGKSSPDITSEASDPRPGVFGEIEFALRILERRVQNTLDNVKQLDKI